MESERATAPQITNPTTGNMTFRDGLAAFSQNLEDLVRIIKPAALALSLKAMFKSSSTFEALVGFESLFEIYNVRMKALPKAVLVVVVSGLWYLVKKGATWILDLFSGIGFTPSEEVDEVFENQAMPDPSTFAAAMAFLVASVSKLALPDWASISKVSGLFKDWSFAIGGFEKLKGAIISAATMMGIDMRSAAQKEVTDRLDQLKAQIEVCDTLLTELSDNPADMLTTRHRYDTSVEEAQDLSEFAFAHIKDPQYAPYKAHCATLDNKLKKLKDRMRSVDTACTSKMIPVTLALCGRPGVGKSYLLAEITRRLSARIGRPLSSYCRNDADPYWSRYEQQDVVVIDDLGSAKDGKSLNELICIYTPAAFHVTKAAVEDKGMPFRSSFLFTASNHAFPESANLTNNDALDRRRDFLIEVEDPIGAEMRLNGMSRKSPEYVNHFQDPNVLKLICMEPERDSDRQVRYILNRNNEPATITLDKLVDEMYAVYQRRRAEFIRTLVRPENQAIDIVHKCTMYLGPPGTGKTIEFRHMEGYIDDVAFNDKKWNDFLDTLHDNFSSGRKTFATANSSAFWQKVNNLDEDTRDAVLRRLYVVEHTKGWIWESWNVEGKSVSEAEARLALATGDTMAVEVPDPQPDMVDMPVRYVQVNTTYDEFVKMSSYQMIQAIIDTNLTRSEMMTYSVFYRRVFAQFIRTGTRIQQLGDIRMNMPLEPIRCQFVGTDLVLCADSAGYLRVIEVPAPTQETEVPMIVDEIVFTDCDVHWLNHVGSIFTSLATMSSFAVLGSKPREVVVDNESKGRRPKRPDESDTEARKQREAERWAALVRNSKHNIAHHSLEGLSDEACTDSGFLQVSDLILGNVISVGFAKALMLYNRIGVTIAHHEIDPNNFKVNGVKVPVKVLKVDKDKDLCFFELLSGVQYPKVTQHIRSKDDPFETSEGVLCVKRGDHFNWHAVKINPQVTWCTRLKKFGYVYEPVAKRNVITGTMFTENGDCGNCVFFVTRGCKKRLLGIHNAGSSVTGLASNLTIEDIPGKNEDICDEAVPRVMLPHQKVVPIEPTYVGPNSEMIGYMGDELGQVRPYHEDKTYYWKSPLYHPVLCEQYKYEPAILGKNDPRCPDGVLPLEKAIDKWNRPRGIKRPEIADEAIAQVTDWYSKLLLDNNRTTRIYTRTEAINGDSKSQYSKAMNRDSSPGYPWNTMESTKGDFLIKDGETWKINLDTQSGKDFMTAINKTEIALKDKKYTYMVFTGLLKDELRPIKKIYDVSTRSIAGGPQEALVLGRQLCDSIISQLMELLQLHPIKVGINPLGFDWHFLWEFLTTYGLDGFAGDFEKFDSSMARKWIEGCGTFFAGIHVACGAITDSQKTMLLELFKAFARPIIQRGHELIEHEGGVMSGLPYTSFVDSLCNLFCWFYVWLILCEEHDAMDIADFGSFLKYVKIALYGDDNIQGRCPVQFWNIENIVRVFKEHLNMTLTNEVKTGEMHWGSLRDCMFLKRGFVEAQDGYTIAPLADEVFAKTMTAARTNEKHYWSDEVNYEEESIQNTFESIMIEASLKTEAFYDDIKLHCYNAGRKYGIELKWLPNHAGMQRKVRYQSGGNDLDALENQSLELVDELLPHPPYNDKAVFALSYYKQFFHRLSSSHFTNDLRVRENYGNEFTSLTKILPAPMADNLMYELNTFDHCDQYYPPGTKWDLGLFSNIGNGRYRENSEFGFMKIYEGVKTPYICDETVPFINAFFCDIGEYVQPIGSSDLSSVEWGRLFLIQCLCKMGDVSADALACYAIEPPACYALSKAYTITRRNLREGAVDECVVCYEDTNTTTKCRHQLCRSCYYLIPNDKCPMCRRRLKSNNDFVPTQITGHNTMEEGQGYNVVTIGADIEQQIYRAVTFVEPTGRCQHFDTIPRIWKITLASVPMQLTEHVMYLPLSPEGMELAKYRDIGCQVHMPDGVFFNATHYIALTKHAIILMRKGANVKRRLQTKLMNELCSVVCYADVIWSRGVALDLGIDYLFNGLVERIYIVKQRNNDNCQRIDVVFFDHATFQQRADKIERMKRSITNNLDASPPYRSELVWRLASLMWPDRVERCTAAQCHHPDGRHRGATSIVYESVWPWHFEAVTRIFSRRQNPRT